MPYRRTTLSKFIIDEQRRSADPRPELTSLLNDIQTACKLIAVATARGTRAPVGARTIDGAAYNPIDTVANDMMRATCEWGGQLAGMVSEDMALPYHIPEQYPRGRYLLLFDPIDGASNIDVNVPVGTIFSVLRCPDGVTDPDAADFLQPGTAQVAAGYAIYGPVAMMVITLGNGVHGFTLDREIGAFMLTHPNMRIPRSTQEFAINVSHERFWEPPIRRYVDECIAGTAGPRGQDFTVRWIASTAAEVHRILICGGLFMYPLDTRESSAPAGLHLLYEANPMAMIVEQAGGAASTGHERLLDIVPASIHESVPAILGSSDEVARIERYYAEHERGEDTPFETPLFNVRSLFRSP